MSASRVRKLRIEITHPMFATPIMRTMAVPKDFSLSSSWLVEHAQQFIRHEAANHYLWVEQTNGSSWFEVNGIISDHKGGLEGLLHVQASEDFSEIWYEYVTSSDVCAR